MNAPKFPLLIVLLAICAASFAGYTRDDIKDGKDKRETIIIRLPASGTTNVTYMAESSPGASPLSQIWVCSKIISYESGANTITIITVMPDLQTPGAAGANLATFDYPND